MMIMMMIQWLRCSTGSFSLGFVEPRDFEIRALDPKHFERFHHLIWILNFENISIINPWNWIPNAVPDMCLFIDVSREVEGRLRRSKRLRVTLRRWLRHQKVLKLLNKSRRRTMLRISRSANLKFQFSRLGQVVML